MAGDGNGGGRISFSTREVIVTVVSATLLTFGTIITWGWWLSTTEAAHYNEMKGAILESKHELQLYKQHLDDTLVKGQETKLKDLSEYVKSQFTEKLGRSGAKP